MPSEQDDGSLSVWKECEWLVLLAILPLAGIKVMAYVYRSLFAWEPLVNDYHILRQEEVYISTTNLFKHNAD